MAGPCVPAGPGAGHSHALPSSSWSSEPCREQPPGATESWTGASCPPSRAPPARGWGARFLACWAAPSSLPSDLRDLRDRMAILANG